MQGRIQKILRVGACLARHFFGRGWGIHPLIVLSFVYFLFEHLEEGHLPPSPQKIYIDLPPP